MSFEHVHRSRSQSPQSSWSTSQFAPRPFPVQEPQRPPTQEEIENEAFQQNKFEAFGLQLKEKHGTITPVEQERLGVLQAKMDGFWAHRMERAKAQPNLLEILIRNSQATQTTESQAPVQSNTIQSKSDTTGDRSESSVNQRPNKTGLPDALKAGVENLSGYSLDNVKVHYNSPKPSQFQALAYTQGTEIHVAPEQEEHLPHEAWHVVQQMQGRVKPTMQMKEEQINDDDGLEKEADVMGGKALIHSHNTSSAYESNRQYGNIAISSTVSPIIQMGKGKKRKKSTSGYQADDDEAEYVPPQGKKQKRFHIPKTTQEDVVKTTAHPRKHVNSRYSEIFTCPGCRRPLASTKGGKGGKLTFADYSYTSKSGKPHTLRSLALDHQPPWAERERILKGKGASIDEMKEDHNDPARLRALCKRCNESHKYETKKKIQYESDTDEEGFFTPDDEPENKGFYKDFRYDK
jgi:hypothetical protein